MARTRPFGIEHMSPIMATRALRSLPTGELFEIQFLGGAGTATGSKYLVTATRSRVLVDCRRFHGLKQLCLHNWALLTIEPGGLSPVV